MVQNLGGRHGPLEELASELARRLSRGMPQRLVQFSLGES